jgi:hypothetical protein
MTIIRHYNPPNAVAQAQNFYAVAENVWQKVTTEWFPDVIVGNLPLIAVYLPIQVIVSTGPGTQGPGTATWIAISNQPSQILLSPASNANNDNQELQYLSQSWQRFSWQHNVRAGSPI